MKTARIALAAILACALAPLASAQDAVGKWKGTLKGPDGELPVGVTITKGADGKLAGNLESPSQAPGQLFPASGIDTDGSKLNIQAEVLQGNYAGVWDDGRKVWVGKWTQNGVEMPLELTRAE